MSQQQKDLTSAFERIELAFNSQGDKSVYFDLYDRELTMHGFPPNVPANFEGLKSFYNSLWTAFPDSRVKFNDLVIQGDKAAVRFTFSGTQKGEFMGISATGKKVTVEGMRFFKFRGTKCIETWNLLDNLSMLQQLGVIKA